MLGDLLVLGQVRVRHLGGPSRQIVVVLPRLVSTNSAGVGPVAVLGRVAWVCVRLLLVLQLHVVGLVLVRQHLLRLHLLVAEILEVLHVDVAQCMLFLRLADVRTWSESFL